MSCCYVVIASLSYVEWNEIANNFGSEYCVFAALTQTYTQPVSIYAITVTMWLSFTTALWVLPCTFPNGLKRTIRDSVSLYCTRFGFDLNRMKCVAVSDLSACVLFWTASVYLRMQCLCSAAIWLCSHVCFALNCYCISFIWFNLIKRFCIAFISFSVTEPILLSHIYTERRTHGERARAIDTWAQPIIYELQHFNIFHPFFPYPHQFHSKPFRAMFSTKLDVFFYRLPAVTLQIFAIFYSVETPHASNRI